jgi:hypothetical protein
LSAGEADAVLADLGVLALGELLDDVMDLGDAAAPNHVGETGIGVGGEQVLVQLVGGEVADVAAVDGDAAVLGLVAAEEQLGGSCRSRRARGRARA